MDWRSEAGASVVTLIASWLMMMGFLGLCVDGALYYVTRQQLQTAADAAATAGAMQARYLMQVKLVGVTDTFVAGCYSPFNDKEEGPDCGQPGLIHTGSVAGEVLRAPGWEMTEWSSPLLRTTQGSAVDRHAMAFPSECKPQTPSAGSSFHCQEIKIVSCTLDEYAGTARPTAQRAFGQNQDRWSGRMVTQSLTIVPSHPGGNDKDFAVSVMARGAMSTHFLHFFGTDRLPVVTEATARYRRLIAPPPGCEKKP